jgi:hypothetical protein
MLTVGDPSMSSLEPLSYPRQVQAGSAGQRISNPCLLYAIHILRITRCRKIVREIIQKLSRNWERNSRLAAPCLFE